MTPQGKSCRPNSITVHETLRELHGRLKAVLFEEDPAPWFNVSPQVVEAFSNGDDVAFIREQKVQERVWLLLLRAVLSGELRAHFSDGFKATDVPAWAWAEALLETDKNRFDVAARSHLPLDVFLPDEWQRWAFSQVFFDRLALVAWIDAQNLGSAEGLPDLPAPYDANSRPVSLTARLPSDHPFVPLSEAISWIAFGYALDTNRLAQAVDSFAFGSPVETQRTLEIAVSDLTRTASEIGKIAIIGKYVSDHLLSASAVLTERIDPIKFHDFARFDVVEDTLRYGTGLTWIRSDNCSELSVSKRPDAFIDVKVNRVDLLNHFPPNSRKRRKAVIPTHEDVVDWCRDWIAGGKGSGMDKAWNVFKLNPAHRGLSRDEAFRPAWRDAKTK